MISIIIPCYSTSSNNHGQFVKRATLSALNQTYSDKEIIIVDDGSPLPVEDIWGGAVKIVRHVRNQGLSAALNTGIAHSTGDRFIILASDDELRHDCLEKLAQQNADVVCSDFQGDKGPPIKCKPADLHTLINVGNCHSYAALIKRSAWAKTPGFRTTMNPSWEDYCAFIDLAKTGAKWAYVPEALHLYHRSMTGRDADAQDKIRLLEGKLHGYHQDCFGRGKGVVSFIIPCYNQERWVGEALESIRLQIYPHVTAVVVDDGSPGKVMDAVKAANGPGDVIVVRQRNKHLSGARNTGIRTAVEAFNPEYMIMLDADDTVEPTFVEELMIAMTGKREYVYSDIRFIGDAWHNYTLKDYNCQLLTERHIHACTFLAQTEMYLDVGKRGYIYDEAMKKGYEDWEFALAAMKAGWCGKRWPKNLFHYRYHNGGSMRMDAVDINNELVTYIKTRHSWIKNKEAITMACASCGGGIKATRIVNKNGGTLVMINVPGIGAVDPREPLRVVYTGHGDNMFTKLGVGGHIYKYSAVVHRMVDGAVIGPEFTIFGADAHLFAGAFQISRVTNPQAVTTQSIAPQPAAKVVEAPVEIPEAQRLAVKFEQREQAVKTVAIDPDDFTQLKGVGAAGAKALSDAGFAFYQDLVDASVAEVAMVLKVSSAKAGAVIEEAKKKL